MKKKLIFLFSMLHLACFSQIEWAPIGAEWYYNYRESPVSPSTGYYHLKSVKDTVIDMKPCRVISKTLVRSKGFPAFEGNEYIYIDPENQKVFRYLFEKFWLLYDFGLEKGDTITIKEPVSPTYYDSITVVIDSISIEMFSETMELKTFYQRKIINSSIRGLSFSGKVIEKLGNLRYFFPLIDLDCDGGCPDPLRCYSDSEINYVADTRFPCDTTYTYTNPVKISGIQIFPNPANDKVSIRSHSGDRIQSVELVNLRGESIFKKVRIDKTEYQIIIGQLPKGTYILNVKSNNELISERIIIK